MENFLKVSPLSKKQWLYCVSLLSAVGESTVL